MEQTLACAPAIRIFDRLLRGFDAPPALRLWNDALHMPNGSTAVTLVLRDPRLLRRLVIQRNPLLLADAYFRGALDSGSPGRESRRREPSAGHFESVMKTPVSRRKPSAWIFMACGPGRVTVVAMTGSNRRGH